MAVAYAEMKFGKLAHDLKTELILYNKHSCNSKEQLNLLFNIQEVKNILNFEGWKMESRKPVDIYTT